MAGMARPVSSRMGGVRGWALFVLVLACVAAWSFGGSLRSPWLFDDHIVVGRLGKFVEGADAREFWMRLAASPRPLRQLTLWVDSRLGGDDPAWSHGVNVAWHAAAAGLWAALLARLGFGRRVVWGAALLFAVLPIHWETLGIVSHRKEQLALVFTLAGLLGLGSRGNAGKLAGMACFALAVLGKESALVFPALAWLAYGGHGSRDGAPRRRWLWAATVLGVVLAVLAVEHVHWSVEQLIPEAPRVPRASLPLPAACAMAVRSFPRYALLMLDPSAVPCLDRALGVPPDRARAWADFAFSSLFCAAWVLAWWTAQRRGSRWALPLGWVPAALAPVLWPSFLASGRVGVLAGRYAYAAVPGMALLLALALDRLPGRKIPWLAMAALVAAFSAVAHARAADFASERALWEATLRHNPASAMACQNLAAQANHAGGPRHALRVIAGIIRNAGRNPCRPASVPPGRRVAVAGDSVPYGWNEKFPAQTLSLAARMGHRAERDFPEEDWTFDNWAVPGSTLVGLAARLDRRLVDNPTDYCVIMAGHNDAVAGTSPDAIADAAALAMATCLLRGATPLWVGPAPVRGLQIPMRARQAEVLAEFSQIVDGLCDETGIAHVPCALPSPPVTGGTAPAGPPDTRQGVHLDFGEMENLAGLVFFEGLRPLADVEHKENKP